MKTHIIRLEPYDDIISARDKMGWGKAGRILLVWPERGRVLYRRLDLVLLQRHSEALGAQLAFVTRDPEVHYHAPRLGIPVYKSLRKAQSTAHWRIPRRFRKATGGETATASDEEPVTKRELPPRPEPAGPGLHPLIRLLVFTFGVLAFLAITAVLLPSAHVTLVPQVQEQELTIDVQAGPTITTVSLSGALPALPVEVVVEGRDTIPASGSMWIPEKPAKGYALFTNLTDQRIYVAEGTEVLSKEPETKSYFVTKGGTVSAGPGESLKLPVRARLPGRDGNVAAGSLVAVADSMGTQLAVTNPMPIQYGTDQEVPVPTERDRLQLYARLNAALRKTALKELEDKMEMGDVLLPGSFELVEVLSESYLPPEEGPADQLELNLRLAYQGLVVSGEDERTLAQIVLDANLPPGYDPVIESLEMEQVSDPVLTDEILTQWKMRARRQIQAQVPVVQAIRLSMGLTPAQAVARLTDVLALESLPQVTVAPEWWPRMPFVPFRITIIQVNGADGER